MKPRPDKLSEEEKARRVRERNRRFQTELKEAKDRRYLIPMTCGFRGGPVIDEYCLASAGRAFP